MIKNTEEAMQCLLSPLFRGGRKVGKCKECKWREFCTKVSNIRWKYDQPKEIFKEGSKSR